MLLPKKQLTCDEILKNSISSLTTVLILPHNIFLGNFIVKSSFPVNKDLRSEHLDGRFLVCQLSSFRTLIFKKQGTLLGDRDADRLFYIKTTS